MLLRWKTQKIQNFFLLVNSGKCWVGAPEGLAGAGWDVSTLECCLPRGLKPTQKGFGRMNSTHFSSANVVATQSCCWLICFGFKKSSGHQNGFGSLIPCKETPEVFSSVLGGYWVIFKACIIGLSKHICFLCLRTKNLIKQTSGTKNVLKKANDSHLDVPKNNNHFRSVMQPGPVGTGKWSWQGPDFAEV